MMTSRFRLHASTNPTRRVVLGSAAISVAAVLATPAASASTLKVCPTCAFTTIQAAVNAAVSGDTISVAPGRYTENVTIQGKALTVLGQDRHLVVVDGGGKGTVFTVGEQNVAGNDVVLSNLTITRGLGSSKNLVENGGGVAVKGGNFSLLHSIVIGNVSNTDGGGVSVFGGNDSVTTEFLDDAIVENHALDRGGGVVLQGNGFDPAKPVTFTQTEISRNVAADMGGGLEVSMGMGEVKLDQVTLAGNSAATGGAIGDPSVMIPPHTEVLLAVTNSTIVNNSATGNAAPGGAGSGGGVFTLAPFSLTHTVLAHNTAQTAGGGIYDGHVQGVGATVTLNDVFVVQNQAAKGAGVFVDSAVVGGLSETKTTISDNTPDNCAAAAGDTCP